MKIKIVYIGTVKFSEILLKEIIKYRNYIDIYIISSKKKINSDHENLNKIAKRKKLPIHLTSDINSNQTLKKIKNFKPDYIFCFGWSRLLKKKIIKCANKYCIGYHPAELPKNRGRHPIIWAIYLGLKNTASTFFKLTEKVDDGIIIDQKILKIKKKSKSLEIYKSLAKISKIQIKSIIFKIINNKKIKFYKKKNQNIWRKRGFVDGVVDWRMSGSSIIRLSNALSYPYPNACFKYKAKYITFDKAKILMKKKNNIEPGKILKVEKNSFQVTCDDSIVKIIRIKPKINLKKNSYL
ncbi:formyltransferase family protein [Candidatus Pelagibacter sp. HIMB1748]|uniref:formyltransferase family protein n=1 Tax=unclassified Candidatus Pelagibacter TaxID=2647897 RepID=UPI003F841E5F